jgi:hypothetical protein
MEEEIVVYQTFGDPILANIMLTRLRDSGFDCFLSGENIVNMGFLFDSPLAEIQLHVFKNEIEKIDVLLKQE